jgi:hypothetical protein
LIELNFYIEKKKREKRRKKYIRKEYRRIWNFVFFKYRRKFITTLPTIIKYTKTNKKNKKIKIKSSTYKFIDSLEGSIWELRGLFRYP